MSPTRAGRVGGSILLLLAIVLAVVFAAPAMLGPLASARLRAAATSRGLDAQWSELRVAWPARAVIRRLALRRHDTGESVFRADSLVVDLEPVSLLALSPRPSAIVLRHGELQLPHGAAADTSDADEPSETTGRHADDPARAARVRRSIEGLARLVTTSTARLPRLEIVDLQVRPAAGSEALWDSLTIGWLAHEPAGDGDRLSVTGTLHGERDVPFETHATLGRDGRIVGAARFGFPDPDGGSTDLGLTLDGRMHQARGRLELDPATRVTIGTIPFRLGGAIDREGPRFAFRFAADSLTQPRLEQSVPRSVLGPLRDLAVRGSWDYRLSLDLDLSLPDSVRFVADVVPHALRLDPERTFLNVLALDQPFVAHIHLPHDRVVERVMSDENPHFRTLDRIAPTLVYGVVTNEDGGYFQHRGFNTRAMREAIAEDVKTGSFKRGAGTITMQLVRNLYLGHDRTISRKLQEVTLAWVLEHLTGVSKERMLEIYLDIIEWGPDVYGADEASRFYFDRDAGDLSLDQSLFLVTLIPSPGRWRSRFDHDGQLRPYARAQMHFIGRAMVAKGWLTPDQLPAADQLDVTLTGPARDLLAPAPPAGLSAGLPAPVRGPVALNRARNASPPAP